MIRRPPRSTLDRSSAASDVYKRQFQHIPKQHPQNIPNESRKVWEYHHELRLELPIRIPPVLSKSELCSPISRPLGVTVCIPRRDPGEQIPSPFAGTFPVARGDLPLRFSSQSWLSKSHHKSTNRHNRHLRRDRRGGDEIAALPRGPLPASRPGRSG